ncbi:hypothetical protein [Dehalococcoides mccartyi]|uniref:hypothetical protein n=1 Tax=Dehalococcoides mccartyi TaxID=61435 RepID=UPI0003C88E4C|nr:hypothetical protein [Dehalococcoides mccartyi]AHB12899.1 hypothetical protein GY50_0113 [Dehalococcoides mccartyi GY50]
MGCFKSTLVRKLACIVSILVLSSFALSCSSADESPQSWAPNLDNIESQNDSSVNEVPSQPVTNTSLDLSITGVTSPVSKGAYATLTAKTQPGALCNITVYYKSGPSSASGLDSKVADSTGNVSWTWKVGTNTTPGSWRIVVTASLSGKTESESKSVYFTVR